MPFRLWGDSRKEKGVSSSNHESLKGSFGRAAESKREPKMFSDNSHNKGQPWAKGFPVTAFGMT